MSAGTFNKCDACGLELQVTGTSRSFWRQRFEFNVVAKTKLIKSDGYSSDELVTHGELCLDCYNHYLNYVHEKNQGKQS